MPGSPRLGKYVFSTIFKYWFVHRFIDFRNPVWDPCSTFVLSVWHNCPTFVCTLILYWFVNSFGMDVDIVVDDFVHYVFEQIQKTWFVYNAFLSKKQWLPRFDTFICSWSFMFVPLFFGIEFCIYVLMILGTILDPFSIFGHHFGIVFRYRCFQDLLMLSFDRKIQNERPGASFWISFR